MFIIFVIACISFIIIAHEAGHFFTAKLFKLKIDEFGFGFPPRIKAFKKGEIEYSLNWLPFGGFVKIAGENDRMTDNVGHLEALPPEEKKHYFLFQPAWVRATVLLAGVFINFFLGWLLMTIVFMTGTPQILVVQGVEPNSPAALAGIKTDDIIKNYTRADEFIAYINENRGKSVTLMIARGAEERPVTAIPRMNTGPQQGALGIELSEAGMPKEPLFTAMKDAAIYVAQLSWLIVTAVFDVIKSLALHFELLEGIAGPVGIVTKTAQIGSLGAVYFIQILAIISINLGVMNLLPFPALDGGRFFMIFIEKIKRAPISLKTEAWVNGLGFAFLLVLMVLVTIRDVSQWF
ncbi:MAG: site-2 protease family protein [bacterium]|nr:site-2 protease family protein [bacterium]